MEKSFGRGAAALAVVAVISKLMGALYRVPLTNILGAAGMGLYQTVFPLFTVLLMVCGGGMTGAISRTVAKYEARGERAQARAATGAALIPLLIFSVAAASAVIIFRDGIAKRQGVPEAALCYIALGPAIALCSGISVLRGVFQGRGMMVSSGVSQLLEQGGKLALGLLFGRLLLPRGINYAVFGALLGVTASELIALIYLTVRYIIFIKGERVDTAKARAPIFRELLRFSLPVTFGLTVIPLTQLFDSAFIVNMLTASGTERDAATAIFGLFVGPVGTLVSMPAVVLSALNSAALPALTARIERGDERGVRACIKKAVFYGAAVALPAAAAFLIFPRQMCVILYGRGLTADELTLAARLMRISAVSVIYTAVAGFCAAALQAKNRALTPSVNLAVGGVVKIVLSLVLVPRSGIEGAAISSVMCYAAAALLDAICVYRAGLTAPVGACVRPLVCTIAASAAFFMVQAFAGGVSGFIAAAVSFAAVYGCVLLPRYRAALPLLYAGARQKRAKK